MNAAILAALIIQLTNGDVHVQENLAPETCENARCIALHGMPCEAYAEILKEREAHAVELARQGSHCAPTLGCTIIGLRENVPYDPPTLVRTAQCLK